MSKAARGFRAYPPLIKITLWVAAIVALASLVQAIAWLAGLDFDVLSQGGGGRGVLLALALATLLAMMAADRRPAADYGLAADPNWARQWGLGLAIGALSYSGYCILAWLAGALVRTGEPLSGYRCASAVLSASTAIPVAVTQQIIFGGYVLSTLKDRYRPVVAALVSAVLFALLSRLENPAEILSAGSRPLLVGMFLIATLLGMLRLRYGSILFPAGLLAGWILVRRLIRKTAFLTTAGTAGPGSEGIVGWMAPRGDPRQAPLLWAFLVVAVAVCWYRLHRHGEGRPAAGQAAATSFKRVFPFSNLNALAPLDLWLAQLFDARFRVGLKYVPRLIVILVFSTLGTVLSLPERLLAPLLLRWRRAFQPVFVVGVHRSGTTHLHNLLSLDRQFRAPQNRHVINPLGMLSFGWLTTPLLGPFMTWARPMDAVRLSALTPQEEEFAIAGMCRVSPYWGLAFPRRVAKHDRCIFTGRLSPREQKVWRRTYLLFLRKLMLFSRKRPLLKSPYNTGRVAVLREMFPRAKFVHLCRHPYSVFSSNRHTARNGFVVFQLQDPDRHDCYESRFLDNYRALEESFTGDAARLPPEDVCRVRFEDLERDPIAVIRRIYASLDLDYDASFHRRLVRYIEAISDYKKNRFGELPQQDRRRIDAQMGPFMEQWGYRPSESSPTDRPAIPISDEEQPLKKAG